MAGKNALSHLLAGKQSERARGSEHQGWMQREVYRARTDDASFATFDEPCDTCGERHRNPYEGDPHYITKKVPVRVAKNWARHHNLVVHVEKRAAYVHKKAGRPHRVQLIPYSDWRTIRTVRP